MARYFPHGCECLLFFEDIHLSLESRHQFIKLIERQPDGVNVATLSKSSLP